MRSYTYDDDDDDGDDDDDNNNDDDDNDDGDDDDGDDDGDDDNNDDNNDDNDDNNDDDDDDDGGGGGRITQLHSSLQLVVTPASTYHMILPTQPSPPQHSHLDFLPSHLTDVGVQVVMPPTQCIRVCLGTPVCM